MLPQLRRRVWPIRLLLNIGLLGVLPALPTLGQDSPASSSLPAALAGARTTTTLSVPTPTPDIPLSNLLVNHWGVKDGLPTNTLINVYRSQDGFLWISTYSGLCRFDGLTFEIFDESTHPQLATNAFSRFAEDPDGTLWLGTQGSGIWRFDDGRLEPFDQEHLGIVTLSLDRDPRHGFWIGLDNGLYRYNGERFEQLVLDGFDRVRVRESLFDDEGTLWVATESHGVAEIRNGNVRWWTEEDGLASKPSVALWQDGERIWVGGLGGLSVIEGDTARALPELDGIAVITLRSDMHGSLWAPASSGLYRIDPQSERVELLDELDGHSFLDLSDIAFDLEGNIWVSSSIAGLFQLRKRRFQTYDRNDGLNSDRVNAAAELSDGNIWVGLDDGTVQRLEPTANGDHRLVDEPLGVQLPQSRVRHFLEDSQGRIWISSYAGLLRREGGRDTLLGLEDGLPSLQIRFTFEDSRGQLWGGTRTGGLTFATAEGFGSFGLEHGLPSNFVFSLDELEDGRLAAGLRGALAILEVEREPLRIRVSESYVLQDGLPGAVVFNTLQDEGWLLLAADGGLGALRDGKLYALKEVDGLPVDTVFDIQRDGLGHYWLNSSAGVVRVERRALLAYFDAQAAGGDSMPAPKFDLFDDADGLSSRQSTAAAPFSRTPDGRFLFPTLNGLSIVDPGDIAVNPVAPQMLIHSLDVDGNLHTFDSDFKSTLELDPGGRRIEFSFAGLSLQQPVKNRLWFRLEGFDPHWIEADSSRKALYTNLPHGTYTFRVVGTNNDGIADLEGARLTVRIEPRFYQTPLFYIVLSLLTFVAVRGFVNWRLQVIDRRNRELQDIVDDQRRTAAQNAHLIEELEAKNREIETRREELERFTYTVSHDLKSPLVTIRGFAGALQQDIQSGDEDLIEQDLSLILGASKHMERLLGELLELSQVGHVLNPPEPVCLTDVAREAVSLTAGSTRAKGAEIMVQESMPVLQVDRSRITEVFQNLVENALKFVPESRIPLIHIGCDSLDGEDIFFVQDNGIGIPEDLQDHIFGLFKRLDTSVEGSGVGLAVVKRTVENHGGRIWVESFGQDQGTTFRFTLKDLTTETTETTETTKA